MTDVKLDPGSRITIRGIAAGVITAFGLATLFFGLAGAFGYWMMEFGNVVQQNVGFWLWLCVAWIICVAIGGYVAASGARIVSVADGMLNGFLVWAASACVGVVMLWLYQRQFGANIIQSATNLVAWLGFFGNLVALAMAMYGGSSAARHQLEERGPESEGERAGRARPFEPAYQP